MADADSINGISPSECAGALSVQDFFSYVMSDLPMYARTLVDTATNSRKDTLRHVLNLNPQAEDAAKELGRLLEAYTVAREKFADATSVLERHVQETITRSDGGLNITFVSTSDNSYEVRVAQKGLEFKDAGPLLTQRLYALWKATRFTYATATDGIISAVLHHSENPNWLEEEVLNDEVFPVYLEGQQQRVFIETPKLGAGISYALLSLQTKSSRVRLGARRKTEWTEEEAQDLISCLEQLKVAGVKCSVNYVRGESTNIANWITRSELATEGNWRAVSQESFLEKGMEFVGCADELDSGIVPSPGERPSEKQPRAKKQ